MFRIRTGLMGVATGLVAGLLWMSAPVAQAQGRDQVRCGSDDGRFTRCQVPWRDAEMIRQESNSPCIRGQTWGVDRGGLWVDRGCRGQFVEMGRGGGGYYPPPGYRPPPDQGAGARVPTGIARSACSAKATTSSTTSARWTWARAAMPCWCDSCQDRPASRVTAGAGIAPACGFPRAAAACSRSIAAGNRVKHGPGRGLRAAPGVRRRGCRC